MIMKLLSKRLRVGLGALFSALLILGLADPASANSYNTGGNATSIWNFTTGSTSYTQNHNGDDFAFDVTGGIAIDARWVTCSGSSTGSTHLNITPDGGYETLGTNFLATTCLHIQYRGYTQTGGFSGTTYWNYSWT